jgi:hypothetical protein
MRRLGAGSNNLKKLPPSRQNVLDRGNGGYLFYMSLNLLKTYVEYTKIRKKSNDLFHSTVESFDPSSAEAAAGRQAFTPEIRRKGPPINLNWG